MALHSLPHFSPSVCRSFQSIQTHSLTLVATTPARINQAAPGVRLSTLITQLSTLPELSAPRNRPTHSANCVNTPVVEEFVAKSVSFSCVDLRRNEKLTLYATGGVLARPVRLVATTAAAINKAAPPRPGSQLSSLNSQLCALLSALSPRLCALS
jgi:hypothetical protein